MEIAELQKALAAVWKADRNATVSSYYTDYIGIWVSDLRSATPKLEATLKKLGWQAVTHNTYTVGWYK